VLTGRLRKTSTFVAALRLDRIASRGATIDGESFRISVEESLCLVPTLREGDIVIMDNLGSHMG
jgi:hypothetical protein